MFALRGGGDDVHAQSPAAARLRHRRLLQQTGERAERRRVRRRRRANRGGGGVVAARLEAGRRGFRVVAAVQRGGGEARVFAQPLARLGVSVPGAERERAQVKRALEVVQRAARVRARGTQPETRPASDESRFGFRTAVDAVGVGASRMIERGMRGSDRPGRYPTAYTIEREPGTAPAPAPARRGTAAAFGTRARRGPGRECAFFLFSARRDPAIRGVDHEEARRYRVIQRGDDPRRVRPGRVLQQHIQGGLDALNQARLQRERVALAPGREHGVHGARAREQPPVPRGRLQNARTEVPAGPRPQVLRLPHVQNLPVRVQPPVHARLRG